MTNQTKLNQIKPNQTKLPKPNNFISNQTIRKEKKKTLQPLISEHKRFLPRTEEAGDATILLWAKDEEGALQAVMVAIGLIKKSNGFLLC